MRLGEIVRTPDGEFLRYVSECEYLDHGDGPFWELSSGTYWRCGIPGLDIVTVAELFEYSGQPVPGPRLVCYMTLGKEEGGAVSLSSRSWVSNQDGMRGYFVFLNGEWTREDTQEIDCIEVAANASIDLSRLPALDAWDALPDCIKVAVK